MLLGFVVPLENVSELFQRRKRGVVLSSQGWQRLQAAELLSAMRDNLGNPYTLEQLSERTGLSVNTLIKSRRRQKPVDQPTLEAYFEAFGLTLTGEDISQQDVDSGSSALSRLQRIPLKGQLPVESPFYVYRPPVEQLCSEEILHPGALIRIKAPRQFGKTSLMAQIMTRAQEQGYRTAVLSLQLADQSVFASSFRFFQWFCAVVTQSLHLPVRLEDYWSPLFGNSYNCSHYFESYLLAASEKPFVLAIDEVDLMFAYPEIAIDFFGMLRAWFEQAKYGIGNSELWQRLRLVIVHSTEVYLPLSLNQSPFNVGLLVELSGFTLAQVKELALRYGLSRADEAAEHLLHLLAGNPYLTQLALFHLCQQELTLEALEQTAIAPNGIFNSHLRRQLGNLQEFPDLLAAMKAVVSSPEGVGLSPAQAFKLQSLGLVRCEEQHARPSCKLYQQYFTQVLAIDHRDDYL